AQRTVFARRRQLAFGLVEVHRLDHAQVVERADHREHDADDGQPQHVALQRGLEHRQLGPEAQERRQAGQRGHHAQDHAGQPRVARVQALVVVDLVGLEAAAGHDDDRAERGRGHDRIADRVEHRRSEALRAAAGHADEQEADVRDGRIREQALEVGLQQRAEVADRQRQHRQAGQQQAPVVVQAVGADFQQAVGHAERGQLGRGADEQRDRGRRALVDVRQPHMERRGAELEGDAGDHEHHAGDQQHRARADRGGDRDLVEHQAAGGAVDQRQAVQQQARSQRAEHEVLDRRFRGQRAVAVDRDQRVRAQRQHFQADVDHGQAAGGDQEHHAGDGEQHQHRDFALVQAARAQVGPGVDQRQDADHADAELEHVGGGVAHEHAAEHGAVPAHVEGDQRGRHGDHQDREDVGDDAVSLLHEQVEHQQRERADDD
ncbi:hypothetical protein CATMIT_01964, partial [Catenibacterium mitsuokai DSM 15897]